MELKEEGGRVRPHVNDQSALCRLDAMAGCPPHESA